MSTPATIVVCDDDDMIVQIVSSKLRALGYDVRTTGNAKEALATVRKSRPSLLILDSMMPGVSGLNVLSAIRADMTFAALPVLMLTARKDPAHVSHALSLGVSDYLVKPFSLADLASHVEKLLKPSMDGHLLD